MSRADDAVVGGKSLQELPSETPNRGLSRGSKVDDFQA
jgi:hypothetical protein